ncbi:PRKC apoptosis WT1 regulator protein [Podarcis raffonei]|uniref:PRKC apoptosis WT1 regulator protein n=1 Tax=Podarcis raffonei TaxID=65483 RepID=UPI00232959BE|nr:PRKC apoptosis WT1 regulator protein [Podarcis raffonei]
MATGGYRASGVSTTTDFLEEWKAKREKMRAKQAPSTTAAASGDCKAPGAAAANTATTTTTTVAAANAATAEVNNNGSGAGTNCVPVGRSAPKEPPPSTPAAGARAGVAEPPPGPKGVVAPGSPEEEKVAAKGKGSSGPSARKGKGQIEKRKLREKRRSTGVVNIPTAESLDEYDDDEAGQKERKREDAITQQNTAQNESASADPSASYILQDTSRTISNRYKSTTNTPDDVSSRYSRTADRTGYNRYSRDANSSGNILPNNSLEKKVEDLEKELAKERQENIRLVRITQDKEELIGKLKEEIDLLNRDLDDIEDENEQLKQENKTLLKVVGQLTR